MLARDNPGGYSHPPRGGLGRLGGAEDIEACVLPTQNLGPPADTVLGMLGPRVGFGGDPWVFGGGLPGRMVMPTLVVIPGVMMKAWEGPGVWQSGV